MVPWDLLDGGRVIEADGKRLGAGAEQRGREIAGRLELAERALDRRTRMTTGLNMAPGRRSVGQP
jgi:hypothetical protein